MEAAALPEPPSRGKRRIANQTLAGFGLLVAVAVLATLGAPGPGADGLRELALALALPVFGFVGAQYAVDAVSSQAIPQWARAKHRLEQRGEETAEGDEP